MTELLQLTRWLTFVDAAAAWAMTYLVHSTLLIGLALLAERALRPSELAARELLWKAALFGGLTTATLQAGLGVEPLGGSWRLPPTRQAARIVRVGPVPTAAVDRALVALGEPAKTIVAPARLVDGGVAESSRGVLAAAEATDGKAPLAGAWTATVTTWTRVGTLLWFGVGIALLAGLTVSYARLFRRLARGRELTEGPDRATLSRLVATTDRIRPVSLFATPVGVPLASGLRRRQIHLPERNLSDLPHDRSELVLAHELAHLERRDPAWLIATRTVEAALFLQPLNRIVRARLQEIAEYRCDDWAVRRTGRPISLAKCLTEVAEWSREPSAWATAPAMAVEGTPIGRRVQRLLARDYPRPDAPRPRWLIPAALGTLLALTLAAPEITGAEAATECDDDPAAEPRAVRSEAPVTAVEPIEPPSPAPPTTVAPTAPLTSVAAPRPMPRSVASAPSAPAAPLARPTAQPAPQPAPAAPESAPSAPEAPPARPEPEPEPRPEVEIAELLEISVAPMLEEVDRFLEEVVAVEVFDTAAIEAAVSEIAAVMEGFEPPLLAEQLEGEMEELRIHEIAEEVAALATPDPETLAEVERLATEIAERLSPDPEATRRISELAEQLAGQVELSSAEAEAIRGELQRITSELRPADAELEQMRAELRAAIARVKPSAAELRARRGELDRIRAELESRRGELLRVRGEAAGEIEQRVREGHERTREEARARREAERDRLHELGAEERQRALEERERAREMTRTDRERLRDRETDRDEEVDIDHDTDREVDEDRGVPAVLE